LWALIFDDAFFEIRDDRLLRDDVYGSSLLDLGFACCRGNVGLPLIQSQTSLLVRLLILRIECVFVVSRPYMQPNEVDLTVTWQFGVSVLSNNLIRDTSGEIRDSGGGGGGGVTCLSVIFANGYTSTTDATPNFCTSSTILFEIGSSSIARRS
jgi:hypothetical protein